MTHDEVWLPGVGSFVAEVVPATFSDRGFTINPPYRRLYFRQRHESGESSLVEFYASSNGIDRGRAEMIVNDFLNELRSVLEERKMIVFPGLGRLRATKENNFFFVADEDLDIFPNGFGLDRISLKSHEETRSEVSAAVAGLKSIIVAPAEAAEVVPQEEEHSAELVQDREVSVEEIATEPAEETIAEAILEDTPESITEPAEEPVAAAVEVSAETPSDVPGVQESEEMPVQEEPKPEESELVETMPESPEVPEAKPEEAESGATEPEENRTDVPGLDATESEKVEEAGTVSPKKTPWKTVLKVVVYILVILAVLFVLYFVTARIAPDFIDRLLYSKEELEIINFGR